MEKKPVVRLSENLQFFVVIVGREPIAVITDDSDRQNKA